eukprot:INCI17215.1.p2 GENE.INCI17215.1~~INCI17215.1.p2  ORF type:complete len:390 (-),score=68.52 INCI17215.1:1721-2890(-)
MAAFLRLSVFVVLAGVGFVLFPRLLDTKTRGSDVVGRETMRAVHFSQYGNPADVLEMLSDAPIPSYGQHQILVEVHAAALNPADYKIIQGNFGIIDPLLTHRPGFDFAGRVVAVGSLVTKFKPGDLVHGMTWIYQTGTLSEYVVVDERTPALKPPNLSFAQAAAVPLVAHTSYYIARFLNEGARVLVLGGGSATGMAAIQVAKAEGASRIVTTCSPRNEALVKQFGADSYVNYRESDVWEVMKSTDEQFDVIYDTIGGSHDAKSGAPDAVWEGASGGVLARGGNLVTITGDDQGPLTVSQLVVRGYQIVTRNLFAFFQMGGAGYHMYTQFGGNTQDLEALDAAGVTLPLDEAGTYEFTLDGVKRAFDRQMTGRARGKVVVVVIGDVHQE